MIYIILIISISYLILIYLFIRGFDKVKDFYLFETSPTTTFAVVIPFRNEADQLPNILQSINKLAYPSNLFEVIFVDDASTDNSKKIILNVLSSINYNLKNIRIIDNERVTNSPKKDAITTAIRQSKFEWIITTDADCIIPKYWLDSFDALIQNKTCKLVVGPVKMEGKQSFLNRFQVLDFLSLQGATMGGFGIKKPFLANGANLAYDKSFFLKLNGFEGNENIASGDDIFLLEKAIQNDPNKISYLKCEKAIVITSTESTWKQYVSQRLRWASKSKYYKNNFAKLASLVVFFMNLLLIILLSLFIFQLATLQTLLYVGLLKFSIDFYLIYKSASFFDQNDYLLSYLISFFVYPFLSVFIVLKSFFGFYNWKGRTFKA